MSSGRKAIPVPDLCAKGAGPVAKDSCPFLLNEGGQENGWSDILILISIAMFHWPVKSLLLFLAI